MEEVLPQAPSKWYLTGFLVPFEAPAEERTDDDGADELDEVPAADEGDVDSPPERPSARRFFLRRRLLWHLDRR